MPLDLPTLFAVTAFATAISGLMLLFAWLQDRSLATLAWWGTGLLVLDVGGVLVVLRGVVPDWASVGLGNAVWLFAYGLMWCGARSFEGRRPHLAVPLGAALAWIMACGFDAVWTDGALRIRIFSLAMFVFTLLIASEYWRARNPELMSRWPTIVILVAYGLAFLARIPIAERLVLPVQPDPIAELVVPIGAAALVLHVFCLAFLVMAMAKERLELEHRRNSLVDPLTGVANRRAFFERGERMLRRLLAEGGTAALLMLDLDQFKRINDTFGHQTGDRVLCAFCETTVRVLRSTDLLGRTGGEEFACLLPGATLTEAFAVAERIRTEFERCRLAPLGAVGPASTVSVGVAVTSDAAIDLAALVATADKALYRAKANGRNRVETVGALMAGALAAAGSESAGTGTAPAVPATAGPVATPAGAATGVAATGVAAPGVIATGVAGTGVAGTATTAAETGRREARRPTPETAPTPALVARAASLAPADDRPEPG
ncbi:diguanylate cyclase [Rhodoplanes serenus]|uniref:diguanylate cyclase n=1 Tax=Rhodoplanes serenus TaxID=200615 RepID=A0A9X5AS16_9BRAD|nr:GGDEF domain-containing protein [Rhodoplanes serenus]MTW15755.1 diguanylate cyclase [Rhodoplanes serenus]